jgi:hypothetical protein
LLERSLLDEQKTRLLRELPLFLSLGFGVFRRFSRLLFLGANELL